MSGKIPQNTRAIAPSTSRADPKPILTMTRDWDPAAFPRTKPGRKKVDTGDSALKKASLKVKKEKKQLQINELESKVILLEQSLIENSNQFSNQIQIVQQDSASLRLENEGLKLLVGELQSQLNEYRELERNRRTHKLPIELLNDDLLPNSKRQRRISPPSGYERSVKVEITSPVSSLGLPFEPHSPSSSGALGSAPCANCSLDNNCFCSEVGYQINHSQEPQSTLLLHPLPQAISTSIALPLRSRNNSGNKLSIWHLDAPIAPPATVKASCSGNPANCGACKDDPFGKAFCASLSNSVCSNNPCSNCPRSNQVPPGSPDIFEKTLADLPCCGAPELCGSLTCGPKDILPTIDNILPLSVPPGIRSTETVPCNEAWEALKLHPNIGFADLRMLADVVAKRTICDGPISSSASSSSPYNNNNNGQTSLRTTSSANTLQLNDKFIPIPYQSLICAADAGVKKRLTVEKEAVQDALNILDKAVGRGF